MKNLLLFVVLPVLVGCTKSPQPVTYTEANLLSVESTHPLADTLFSMSLLTAKKLNDWAGFIFLIQGENKFGLYNITTKQLLTYPSSGSALPVLFQLEDFCLLDDKITLTAGNIEIITLDYNLTETGRSRIDYKSPGYWALRGYLDVWDDKMITALALPPIEDFPGLFSFVENKQPKQFLGKIPDYLKVQNTFRDHPGYIAYRYDEKFYIKLQFDTLLLHYDLATFQEEKINIPAPFHFQQEANINKLVSPEAAMVGSDIEFIAEGKKDNAHFNWLKITQNFIFYLYTHYDESGAKVHTLYRYAPGQQKVEYQDVTDILSGTVFFQKDYIFSMDRQKNELTTYQISLEPNL